MDKSVEREPIGIECSTPGMFWQGALPRKFANFKVQNEECHYYDVGIDIRSPLQKVGVGHSICWQAKVFSSYKQIW